MTQAWAQTAMWLGLALIATLLSIWLKVATALSEIVVDTIAQLVTGWQREPSSWRPTSRQSSSCRAQAPSC